METGSASSIQERIKRMIQAKKSGAAKLRGHEGAEARAGRPESASSRRQSTTQFYSDGVIPSESCLRPPSTASKRLASTADSVRSETEVRQLVQRVFEFGVHLGEFLQAARLDAEESRLWLEADSVFLLSLTAACAEARERPEVVAEKAVIARLQRSQERRAQQERCERAELKLAQLIEGRLAALKPPGK